MRIVVNTAEQFVKEVQRAPRLYQDCVRILIDREPLQKEHVSFAVTVLLTALVMEEDGSDYLLEMTKYCGVDNVHGPMDGSEAAAQIEQQLADTLPQHVQVRPGKIEQ